MHYIQIVGSEQYPVPVEEHFEIEEPETKLVIRYLFESSGVNPICRSTSSFTAIEIDGEEKETLSTAYLTDAGEHIIKFTIKKGGNNISGYQNSYIIDSSTFASLNTILDVYVPDLVEYIGSACFVQCVNLRSFHLPKNIKYIGSLVFAALGLSLAFKEVIIPKSLQYAPSNIFDGTIVNTITFEGIVKNGVSILGYNSICSTNILKKVIFKDLLGNYEFTHPSSLTIEEIVLSEKTTNLVNNMFWGFKYLSKINLDNIKTIGVDCFNGCKLLTNVKFSKALNTIGNRAFIKSGLISIIIPENVSYIGQEAFNLIPSLLSIYVKPGNNVFDSRNNCNSIIKTSTNTLIIGCNNSTIPNTVTNIDSYAFEGCVDLTTITIPNSVTSIGTDAFVGCYMLQSNFINNSSLDEEENNYWGCNIVDSEVNGLLIKNNIIIKCKPNVTSVTIPDNITEIGDYAFYECSNLTSVIIPDNVTSIGKSAFNSCTNLTNITIGSGVTNIGNSAFSYCSSLTSVNIPSSVTSIGSYAFGSCSGLTSIEVEATTPPTLGSNVFDYTNNCPIYVHCQSLTTYRSASGWSAYSSRVICNSTAAPITYHASSKLVETTSTENTSGLHTNSFSGSSGQLTLVEHTFADGVGTIQFTDDVTSIGDYAFNSCSSLTSIDIPDSVTSIGSSAFGSCSGLTSIDIPDSVTSIGGNAFQNCSGLTSCTIGSGVTSIGDSAFGNCIGLTSINIPDSVTSIGNYAFQYCSGLTSIDIPSGVRNIGQSAFDSCYSLTSVNIPSGVTSIGQSTFYGCSSLTSIDIPSGVTSIGNNAFYNCTGLTSIEVEATTPPTLTNNAFSNTNSCPIYVPCQSLTAYRSSWSSYSSRIMCHSTATPITYYASSKLEETTATGTTSGLHKNSFSGSNGKLVMVKHTFENGVGTIQFNDDVTSIGTYAFYGCSGLTSIDIPSGVTNFGQYVFSGCSSLTEINVEATTPPTLGSNAFDSTNNCPIYVPCQSLTTYRSSWSSYSSRIMCHSTATPITYHASSKLVETTSKESSGLHTNSFSGSSGGQLVMIKHTFENGVGTIQFNDDVTSIGGRAFYGCSGLTSINTPNSVTTIGSNAFFGCTGLTSIDIPSGVTIIGLSAFAHCNSLTSIEVEATTPPTSGSSVFDYTNNCPIYVPCGSVSTYKSAGGWNSYSSRITCHSTATPIT